MNYINDLLVGSTGFVGSNLLINHSFKKSCHSTNVKECYGLHPELCVYAGIPAAMFLANSNPAADLDIMRQARQNLRLINPDKVVLISSIAVYFDSKGMNENSKMDEEKLTAYGYNRLQLEKWIREDFPSALIVRLPALYGKNLKKNFLYDLHMITPAMIKSQKFEEIRSRDPIVEQSYSLKENGFYCLNHETDMLALKSFFSSIEFNALSFTDSRSKYQFYNLSRLWSDIIIGLDNGFDVLNLCTPPVSARTVYAVVTGKNDWINEISNSPYDYDLRSIHSNVFGRQDGYLCTEEEELEDIKRFMESWE